MCRRHYDRDLAKRKREAESPRILEAFTCKGCGIEVPSTVAPARARNSRQFCTRPCMSKWFVKKKSEDAAAARSSSARACRQCKCDISHRKPQAKFCSVFCSDVSRGARLAEPLAPVECALDGCEVVFTPNRRGTKCCSENHGQIHWNRVSRAEGRQKPSPWNERRKASYHQRRALKRQLPADNIRPADVYERDEWVCGLCSAPVDRNLTWPDPLSPSLDHILPLSLGGHHTMANVQLAHLSCNVRKGNRVEADAMSA